MNWFQECPKTLPSFMVPEITDQFKVFKMQNLLQSLTLENQLTRNNNQSLKLLEEKQYKEDKI